MRHSEKEVFVAEKIQPKATPGEPIRKEKDLKLIKMLLQDNPRDLAIFTVGVNVALRVSDLTKLTVGHFREKEFLDTFRVFEKKTKKWRTITINQSLYDAVQPILKSRSRRPDDTLLFRAKM